MRGFEIMRVLAQGWSHFAKCGFNTSEKLAPQQSRRGAVIILSVGWQLSLHCGVLWEHTTALRGWSWLLGDMTPCWLQDRIYETSHVNSYSRLAAGNFVIFKTNVLQSFLQSEKTLEIFPCYLNSSWQLRNWWLEGANQIRESQERVWDC